VCYVLLAAWEVRGQGNRKTIDLVWISKRMTKVLINIRFRLNRLIDNKARKPPEVTDKQWNWLVAMRVTEESKMKSEKMRKVSKGKGTRATQMAALREAAVVKLVRLLSCMYCPRLAGNVVLWTSMRT
jgi:hypothetical protein